MTKIMKRTAALVAVASTVLATASVAAGKAPAPCGGQAQISDATGDGHHNTTDVLSAWLSEESGRLQAVIKVQVGNWAPDHEDAEVAGFAFLFRTSGQAHYVRAVAPRSSVAPIRYDYGTWTLAGGFASVGPTTGEVVGGGGGTATLDLPASIGAVSGTVLTDLFVLTYDDLDTAAPTHWVDRAPGGVTPTGTEFGADYVVGSCGAGGGPGGGVGGLTAVQLRAPGKRTGAGRVTVRGNVVPARGGLPVDLSVTARRRTEKRLTTRADGSFSIAIRLSETTRIRAVASGLGSQTRTVTVVSKTRIAVRRLRGGGWLIRGRVSPALPGRVLLLRTTAIKPAAKTTTRKGRFRFSLKKLNRGRYQAVFIPSKGRAERSTSNKGVVR